MNEETWERVGLLIAKRLAELQELAEFYGIDSLHVSIPGSNLVTRKAEAFYVTDKLGKVDTKSVEVWEDGRIRVKYDEKMIYDRLQIREPNRMDLEEWWRRHNGTNT